MALSLAEVAIGAAPWFVGFQALQLLSWLLSPILFETFSALSTSDKCYWAASITSSLHALFLCPLIAYTWVQTPELLQAKDVYVSSDMSFLVNHVFIGYLSSDMIGCFYWRRVWPGSAAILIHHCVGVLVWVVLNVYGFMHLGAMVAAFMEATTPFVNFRWFFDKAGMKGTTLFMVNGLTMTLLWFVVRIIAMGYLGVIVYRLSSDINQIGTTAMLTVYGGYTVGYSLQWFWGIKIFRGALKVISSQGTHTKST